VIDLHGRLDRVRCMNCNEEISRYELDEKFSELNPKIQRNGDFEFTPDGDAEINDVLDFKIVACQICQGILKPDVVFFGETVPAYRVDLVMKKLDEAEVLLIAGSSLTVNSGFRFARQASRTGTPIIIVNIGKTKADEFATAKIEANTSAVLERLLND
jgi:NAD-dependent SIR2 family protein deacetylase